MTREEEITNAALEECAEQTLDCKWAFMHGAKWSDEHPRKRLVDIDKVCEFLRTTDIGTFPYKLIEELRKAMEE